MRFSVMPKSSPLQPLTTTPPAPSHISPPIAYIYCLQMVVQHTDKKDVRGCVWGLWGPTSSRFVPVTFTCSKLRVKLRYWQLIADCISVSYRTVRWLILSIVSNGQTTACISNHPRQRAVRLADGTGGWLCSGSQPGKCGHCVCMYVIVRSGMCSLESSY
jgi:hypothetical protein